MNLDLAVVSKVMDRDHDPQYNIDYLLDRAQRGLVERIGDLGWSGGHALAVDFKAQTWLIEGAAKCSMQSAYRCLDQGLDLFGGLKDENYDLVVLNLLPAWGDYTLLLEQVRLRLFDEGLFAFCTFGPDTLSEVAGAWAEADNYPHIHSFIDMHHLGDAMLHSGLVRPIVDTEWLTIEFPDYQTLVRDLRSSGLTNINALRRKSLTGKQRYAKFDEHLRGIFGTQGLSITFELIFGLGFVQSRKSMRVQPPQL